MVVDGDADALCTTRLLLETEGLRVESCRSGREAIEKYDEGIYTVVLDISLPDIHGVEVLEAIRKKNSLVPIILYTGLEERDRGEMRRNLHPHTYIFKGCIPECLLNAVVGAIECYRRTLKALELERQLAIKERENVSLRKELGRRIRFEDICTRDPKMKEAIAQAQKSTAVSYPVLITGESGTGKELLSRAIHYNSPRIDKPFVTINCGAIPKELLESELFGHEKGSFTGAIEKKLGLFEVADQGSIFLDEIGDLSASAQAKILRVLQEKEFQRVGGVKTIKVDVRVISATNKNLSEEIEKGSFREDLFYRLSTISIHLTPLRERKDDVLLLTDHFLKKISQEVGKRIRGISAECIRLLEAYGWPGNVRELQNIIERLVTLAEDESTITEDLLPLELLTKAGPIHHYKYTGNLYETVHALERDIIAGVLKETGGNKSKAAEFLGISRPLLYKKMEFYGLIEPAQDSALSERDG
ncbi:MAG: sigma-54 dependent transcriptional regulator [Candidatus Brocadiaceae bacterium]|nr:sigma-54 dependent transcriptional regulator [Candidatus Brocadiaceae bacterium]